MKRIIQIITLFFLTLLFISSAWVKLTLIRPAAISVPHHVQNLIILDRTLPKDQNMNIVEEFLTGEIMRQDEQAIQHTIDGVVKTTLNAPRFYIKRSTEKYIGETSGTVFPEALPWEVIERLCKKYEADAVVAVETFDTDYIITNGTQKVQGLLEQNIEALWKDIDDFNHVFRGIAVTARYVPTNRIVKNPMSEEEFKKWEGEWYNTISDEPFTELLKKGSVVVLDVQGDGDCGSVGSYNSLAWVSKGAVGIVSNGGIRDTDEIIKQKIPVYLDINNRGRGIRPGRNEIESVNKPVTIGGVLINPGDIIVADGDGVIVVPRKYAIQVAKYAQVILDNDKNGRRNLYQELGIPLDHTVESK